MTLKLQHFDDSDNPFDFDPEKHATTDLISKGEHTYPATTKLFDDEEGEDPVLVFHAEKKYDGKLPFAASLNDTTNPKRQCFYDLAIATEIATHATREVRRLLPLGALNAVYPLDPTLVPDDAPANFNHPTIGPDYVCGKTAPSFLLYQAEMIWLGICCPGNAWLSPFEQLLANYYRTVYVGAGVCSMMASVSAALLSMSTVDARQHPNRHTKILNCSHGADHSFALVQYGESPWIVVDPWVAEPYAVAIEENLFEENGKGEKDKFKAYSQIDVFKRFSDPFGIPLMSGWKDDHLDSPEIEGLRLKKASIVRSIEEANLLLRGVERMGDMRIGDAVKWSSKNKQWYKNKDAKCRVSNRSVDFHTPSMWQQGTNVNKGGEEWAKYRAENPPIVRSNEWGLNVRGNYDAYPRTDDEEQPAVAE